MTAPMSKRYCKVEKSSVSKRMRREASEEVEEVEEEDEEEEKEDELSICNNNSPTSL